MAAGTLEEFKRSSNVQLYDDENGEKEAILGYYFDTVILCRHVFGFKGSI